MDLEQLKTIAAKKRKTAGNLRTQVKSLNEAADAAGSTAFKLDRLVGKIEMSLKDHHTQTSSYGSSDDSYSTFTSWRAVCTCEWRRDIKGGSESMAREAAKHHEKEMKKIKKDYKRGRINETVE